MNARGTKGRIAAPWVLATGVSLFVSLVPAAASPLSAQGLGVMAGLNFSDQGDIDAGSADATFENSTGYHLGVAFEVRLGPLAVRPGALYQRIGTYRFPTGQEMDLSAVEVPLDVRVTVLSSPLVSPYVVAGPVLTFPRGEGALDEAVEELSLTADVGVGAEVSLPGAGFRLLPELRYSIGVTDYLEDSFVIDGSTIQPASDERRMAEVMLRLHVMF